MTGFEYPDSPLQVDQEFQPPPAVRARPREVGRRSRPSRPRTWTTTRDHFVVDSFAESYGDPQPVQATVKRKLGDVTMKLPRQRRPHPDACRPRTSPAASATTRTTRVYYHRVRGVRLGHRARATRVEVWFTAGGEESEHFTYKAVAESDNPVLLLSDEDWSGVQPNPAPLAGPQYLDDYKDAARRSLGIGYDVYDVDAQGPPRAGQPRRARPLLPRRLVHGRRLRAARARTPRAARASTKLAVDTQNRVRDFINEGGKLFYTGQNAGRVFAEGYDVQPVPGRGGARTARTPTRPASRCRTTSCSTGSGANTLRRRRRHGPGRRRVFR